MKRRTYNNMVKAVNLIRAKGYEKEEANDIAIRIFDEHENDVMPIEWYIEKIIRKE